MHSWGDEKVDWSGIEDCCNILRTVCTRWGRVGGQIKEKYGSCRFYAQFTDGTLQSLIWPGYAYIQGPTWFYYYIDEPMIRRITKYTGLRWLIRKYQCTMYALGYRICEYLYPHLFEEIYHMCDYIEITGYTMEQFGWLSCSITDSAFRLKKEET